MPSTPLTVAHLMPDIAGAAVETERTRTPSGTVITSLVDAGVFRMMQPRAFGGSESTPLELFSTVREISSACTSTGWIVAATNVSAWLLVGFGDAAARDVWEATPDALVAAAVMPTGQLRQDRTGLRLSGQWRSVTGCTQCEWLILGALVLNADGVPVEHAQVLVPRNDVRFADSSRTVGLAAVGCHDVAVEDVLIPPWRVSSQRHRSATEQARHLRSIPTVYRHSVTTMYCAAAAVPLIGAAQGAYRAVLDQWNVANQLTQSGRMMIEAEAVHAEIGRAAFEIDTAVLHLERDFAELQSLARSAKRVPIETFTRVRRNQVLSVRLAEVAVDRLVKVAGREGVTMDHPVQRVWRDIHTGASNRANREVDAVAISTRAALGFDIEHSEARPVI
ncbi:acyl-CoA dehydrogenase family protein [Rhodococcus sp. ACT016]|uniref:acyl-CoA dehydrogenase family protein n=1 Tax=Rhodococcus sp. ACT016 TaxID=3134808 RepID=UPI003D2CBCE1